MNRTAHGLVAGLALLVLASACGSTSIAQSSPSPSAPVSPSPTTVACSTSGAASPSWPDAASAHPGTIVSAVAGGDTLTLTFSQGVPQYDITPQSAAQFTADPSGQAVTLQGGAGVLIKLRGFQATAQGNLGTITTSSLGPELTEVRKIGDFEGVVSIAGGLSSAGCAVVTAGDSSLEFHFARTGA